MLCDRRWQRPQHQRRRGVVRIKVGVLSAKLLDLACAPRSLSLCSGCHFAIQHQMRGQPPTVIREKIHPSHAPLPRNFHEGKHPPSGSRRFYRLGSASLGKPWLDAGSSRWLGCAAAAHKSRLVSSGWSLSTLPPKAGIRQRIEHVCFVPEADFTTGAHSGKGPCFAAALVVALFRRSKRTMTRCLAAN